MEILTDVDFVPNETPMPLRPKYKEVESCINRMLYEQYVAGAVLILPTAEAVRIPGIHYSSISWTKKALVAKGRLIGDPSNAPYGSLLNGDGERMKTVFREKWGEINHPTLTDIVRKVLKLSARVPREDIVMWKMDLANAFGLLDIRPSDARKMAFSLSGGLTLVHMFGMFGWGGTPFAFDPITRVLRRMIAARVSGESDMYVDDVIGCSERTVCDVDVDLVADLIRRLLGPNAVNPKKTQTGKREMDVIGWHIDLDTWTVYLAEHNFHKTFIGFFAVDTSVPVTRATLEKLTSWASRYSEVVPLLKPFVTPLYRMLKRSSASHAQFNWTVSGSISVAMWRACLCLGAIDRVTVVRSLDSFAEQSPDTRILYDGSLFGMGIVVEKSISGRWVEVVHASLMVGYDNTTDSSFQNAMEFSALVLGLVLMKERRILGSYLLLTGDSTTALKWGQTGKTKSDHAFPASILFAILGTRFGVEVVSTEHIPGVDNEVCDRLSRGVLSSDPEFDEATIHLDDSPALQLACELSNPYRIISSIPDFLELWGRAQELMDLLVPTSGKD